MLGLNSSKLLANGGGGVTDLLNSALQLFAANPLGPS
jgi:hypothetical protein